jgi:hypothetical protein
MTVSLLLISSILVGLGVGGWEAELVPLHLSDHPRIVPPV